MIALFRYLGSFDSNAHTYHIHQINEPELNAICLRYIFFCSSPYGRHSKRLDSFFYYLYHFPFVRANGHLCWTHSSQLLYLMFRPYFGHFSMRSNPSAAFSSFNFVYFMCKCAHFFALIDFVCVCSVC